MNSKQLLQNIATDLGETYSTKVVEFSETKFASSKKLSNIFSRDEPFLIVGDYVWCHIKDGKYKVWRYVENKLIESTHSREILETIKFIYSGETTIDGHQPLLNKCVWDPLTPTMCS